MRCRKNGVLVLIAGRGEIYASDEFECPTDTNERVLVGFAERPCASEYVNPEAWAIYRERVAVTV